jgi:Flp pilus assembly protein TadG
MDRRLKPTRRQRGDAVVEFVLVAPVLLLLFFGIMEMSRVIDAWVIVHNAAREGARAGSLAYPDPAVGTTAQQVAKEYLTSGLGSRGDIVKTVVNAPVVTGESVQVTAEADVRIYTPMFQAILPSPIPVRATATMRRQ